MHYVHESLWSPAKNFTPFGNFHVMSQTQMQSTVMGSHNSQSSSADMNALQLTPHQEERLNALIGAHTLEGVITLAHGINGYIEEVTGILKCAVCFMQDTTEYQATLCHRGQYQALRFALTVARLCCGMWPQ